MLRCVVAARIVPQGTQATTAAPPEPLETHFTAPSTPRRTSCTDALDLLNHVLYALSSATRSTPSPAPDEWSDPESDGELDEELCALGDADDALDDALRDVDDDASDYGGSTERPLHHPQPQRPPPGRG